MVYFGNSGFIAPTHSHEYLSFVTQFISLSLDEVITIGDSLDRLKYVSRDIFEPVMTFDDVVDFIKTRFVNAAETIGISAVLTRSTIKLRSISESIGISDAVVGAQLITRSISESIGLSDAVTMARTKARSISQSISIGETLTRATIKLRSFISVESVTVSAVLSRAKVSARTLSETITIGETLTRLAVKIRALVETITIGEALTKASLKFRNVNPETITLTDVVAFIKKSVKTLSETITLGESIARSLVKTRTLTQIITISDQLLRGKFIAVFRNETAITISDALTKAKTSVRSLADTVTVSDALTRTKISARSLAESIGISDALTRAKSSTRTLAETIGVTDSLSRIKSIAKTLAETVGITDAVTKAKVRLKSLAESISLSDALTLAKVRGLLILESISIGDFAAAIRLILGAPRWILTGQSSDFIDSLENLVKAYVNSNWTISAPALGTNTASQAQIDNFAYDGFRTYYLKIKEVASNVTTRRIRYNTYEFETPIEFEIYSRRLSKGEAFSELNNVINELMRIFGTFQKESIFGIQGITFDRITAIEREVTPAQTLWIRRLQITLHYYKISTVG